MSTATTKPARIKSKPAADHFDSAAEAIRRNPGLSRIRLYRMGLTGQVRVQLIGGMPPRYSRADIARELARDSVEA